MHFIENCLVAADKNNFTGLERYRSILDRREKPRFVMARENGQLSEKIRKAGRMLEKCELCERRCRVNRKEGIKGFCGVGDQPRVFGAHAHYGEEPELVPSATLFFSGCTMNCVYCQNAPESVKYEMGFQWTPERMAGWIDEMAARGCRNINFVGGDPTPDLPWILEALGMVKTDIPVVWNSNSYYSQQTADLLRDVVDVYLLDFRYWSERCSVRLSSAPDYPEVARRNLLTARQDAELLIRVLVMPNHIRCDAKPILRWISKKIGPGTRTNILAQYRPCWHASEYMDIDMTLSRSEYEKVVAYAKKTGLKNLVR